MFKQKHDVKKIFLSYRGAEIKELETSSSSGWRKHILPIDISLATPMKQLWRLTSYDLQELTSCKVRVYSFSLCIW